VTPLAAAAESLTPRAAAAVLHGVRLLPVALSCPFLGGPLAPALVRLSLAFGLGACAWAVGGAGAVDPAAASLAGAAARELALGIALAFVAQVPFEAARAGGRVADTLRGATLAELHVAPLRQRESASGDLLANALVVLAATTGGDRLVVTALLSTFQTVPAGASWPGAAGAGAAAGLAAAGELLACSLAVGAPAAAGVLAADLALALAARTAPQLAVAPAAQPARASLGLAALAVSASAIGGRLASSVALSAGLVRAAGGAR
jgi:type III secretion protein T